MCASGTKIVFCHSSSFFSWQCNLAPFQRIWPFLISISSIPLSNVHSSLCFALAACVFKLYSNKVYITYRNSVLVLTVSSPTHPLLFSFRKQDILLFLKLFALLNLSTCVSDTLDLGACCTKTGLLC